MAAALACLDELEASAAIDHMAKIGAALQAGIERQATTHRQEVRYTGPPAIPFMTFTADRGSFERSRVFAAACASHGVYLHPHHNWFLSAALTAADVARVLEVTDEAFRAVAAHQTTGSTA